MNEQTLEFPKKQPQVFVPVMVDKKPLSPACQDAVRQGMAQLLSSKSKEENE